MMYGKSTKMSESKTSKKDTKKAMPLTVMIAIGKTRPMPTRGGRTATNMMKKSGRGK
jgi:hypothetical protein